MYVADHDEILPRLTCLPVTVYRVHWLRTKAQCDRWAEELVLVRHEMDWTHNFFLFKSKQWDARAQKARLEGEEGHACYAARQAQVYSTLAERADESFRKIRALPAAVSLS